MKTIELQKNVPDRWNRERIWSYEEDDYQEGSNVSEKTEVRNGYNELGITNLPFY
jgi:hypothetical protein